VLEAAICVVYFHCFSRSLARLVSGFFIFQQKTFSSIFFSKWAHTLNNK